MARRGLVLQKGWDIGLYASLSEASNKGSSGVAPLDLERAAFS